METFYFLGITLGGGLMALFVSAGWSSFKHRKIPEKAILFRWFIAGIVAAGLLAYAWIFGSGGDVGEVMQRIGGALDISETLNSLGKATTAAPEVAEVVENLKIGMPNF
jgi:hypothetical protein